MTAAADQNENRKIKNSKEDFKFRFIFCTFPISSRERGPDTLGSVFASFHTELRFRCIQFFFNNTKRIIRKLYFSTIPDTQHFDRVWCFYSPLGFFFSRRWAFFTRWCRKKKRGILMMVEAAGTWIIIEWICFNEIFQKYSLEHDNAFYPSSSLA